MKNFFSQLRPMERRLAVAVLVAVILVLNWWFIWPHFSEWGNLRSQLQDGQQKLALYQKTIAGASKYDGMIKNFENQGDFVQAADQAINFLRTIQSQSAASGVALMSMGRDVTYTNQFFIEETKYIDVAGNDKQLVDFLYKLGSSASMIRVLDLELQPDGSKTRLDAHVELMASYQKNPPRPTTNKNKTSQANTSTALAATILEDKSQTQNPHPYLP